MKVLVSVKYFLVFWIVKHKPTWPKYPKSTQSNEPNAQHEPN